MRAKTSFTVFMGCVLLTAFLSSIPFCVADDHKGSWKHLDGHSDKKGGFFGGGHDDGNETTGQIVAWSFAAVNLTVAFSLTLKAVKKFVPLGPELQSSLSRFNSTQKKYLMRFHYLLNPIILLFGLLHWSLSRCRSTALPEWGLLTMGGIVALGIILKFKLCPKAFLRNVYRVHTQPVLLLILVSMLLIGHLSMD